MQDNQGNIFCTRKSGGRILSNSEKTNILSWSGNKEPEGPKFEFWLCLLLTLRSWVTVLIFSCLIFLIIKTRKSSIKYCSFEKWFIERFPCSRDSYSCKVSYYVCDNVNLLYLWHFHYKYMTDFRSITV